MHFSSKGVLNVHCHVSPYRIGRGFLMPSAIAEEPSGVKNSAAEMLANSRR